MVENKKTKRERDIKSKLMAAIAMLLVSSIMMVSTTYAWFTLSTAPEVTGITTAVGANGNLEMALLPGIETAAGEDTDAVYYTSPTTALAAITSDAGDSMAVAGKTKEAANITWGNLVDLSPASYHMSDIILYPSQLNELGADDDGNPTLNLESLLQTPTYGADGRVKDMKPVTGIGMYTEGGFFNGKGYGVRAIGNVSGMTAREQAFVTALANASAASKNAQSRASTILNEAGTSLATMAMRKALDDNATFTKAEVQVLLDAYTKIESGPMVQIRTSILEYTVAAYLNNVADDAMSDDLMTSIRAVTDLSTLSTTLGAASIAGLNNLSTLTTAYTTTMGNVNKYKGELTTLLEGTDENATFTWDQIDDAANGLSTTAGMTLNGTPLGELTAKDESGNYTSMGTLIGMVTSGKGFVLDVTDGTGIYADMSKFVGKITGDVKMKNVEVPGLGVVEEIPATMNIVTTGTGVPYLDNAKTAIGSFKATAGATASNNPISDFYGYIVDMGFRTNAADSSLKLQTVGIDRIYTGNTANPETMGGGSTMTFTGTAGAATGGTSTTNIPNLMKCIRVIFFDPDDGTIYGYARLDAAELSTQDDTANGKVSYTMPLKMWDPTGNAFKTGTDAANIVGLNQNEAKAVSVMVYLDGTTITNAEASTANINGTMNIQFSSTAELSPMKYDDLRTGANGSTESQTPAGGEQQEPETP